MAFLELPVVAYKGIRFETFNLAHVVAAWPDPSSSQKEFSFVGVTGENGGRHIALPYPALIRSIEKATGGSVTRGSQDGSVDETDRLKAALRAIAQMTDADNPESYRADDREGCLDAVFAKARAACPD